MIYHVLTELAGFSEYSGGAISRWVANVIREEDSAVVCTCADATWGFPPERVVCVERGTTGDKQGFLRGVTSVLLDRVGRGDVLWVHNRPQFAVQLRDRFAADGVRVVLHMHNSLRALSWDLRRRADTAKLADIPVVFVSHFLKGEARLDFDDLLQRTYVLHNGADGSLFRPAERIQQGRDRTPTIVCFGRLAPNKGVHVLIDAMRRIREHGIDARCQIIGASFFGGSPETAYTRGLREDLPDNVQLLGYLTGRDLAGAVRAADVACVPSTWPDSFPLAVLEAMASGLPVVASRTGGIPEALEHGGGILVPPGSGDALANALGTLILDPERRVGMGADAIGSFRAHFQWSHVRAGYRSIIGELMATA